MCNQGPLPCFLRSEIRIFAELNLPQRASLLLVIFIVCLATGCGGGASSGGSVQPNPQPQNLPVLTTIAPSTAPVGASSLNLLVYGSNFQNGATVQWNGIALSSSWIGATQMTATVPASNFASAGNAKVTVTNPSPGGVSSNPQTFSIDNPPRATTWVRSISGITTAHDIVWDAAHGKLYVSISSADPNAPNSIVPIDPVKGSAGPPVAAGNNPDLLAISSDSDYLWVGLDGDNAVQRFLLPRLTKDISFTLPLDSFGETQRPVDAMVKGDLGLALI
jgi:trimeric autotransporter adhesin